MRHMPDTSSCVRLYALVETWPSWLCPLGSDTLLAIYQGSFFHRRLEDVGILTPDCLSPTLEYWAMYCSLTGTKYASEGKTAEYQCGKRILSTSAGTVN